MITVRDLKRIRVAVVLLVLVSGCSKKDIEGVIKDPFGNGVAGVSVQILKTQFKTVTDRDGRYSLDYVPGTFTIRYLKDGYTTHRLN